MAIYINYADGEDDAVVQGAEWLRNVLTTQKGEEAEKAFSQRFTELHNVEAKGFDYSPIFNLFLDHSEDLFASIPKEIRTEERVKEVESFYAVVFHLLLLFDDQKDLEAATVRLCDIFSSQTTHADLRLRLLYLLYNTYNLPTVEIRYRVFKYIVDYAAKAGLFDQVLPYLEHLDNWMADWDKYMTVDDKRTLYKDMSKYMRDLRKPIEAFNYVKKYHLLYKGADAKAVSTDEVTDMAVLLLKDAIQLPSVMQFDDILAYDTVKALAKTKHAELVKLCNVFLSGTVNDLRDFQTKQNKVFDEYDINFTDAMSKMRLLTLATLAHGRSEMSLAEVAKALEEKEDAVEPWVVRAISEGVVDGRIDQLNHKVLVQSSFQRKFEKEEWAFLDTKLTQWIDNLENVIKFIGDQKAAKDAVLAA